MLNISKFRLFSHLNKDDIFISYGRRDGRTYTDGLATQLHSRKFSCYYDAYGTDAGDDPQPSLFEKVNTCSMLVVIGSKYACASIPVKKEIERYTTAKGTTSVIVIDFDNATSEAIWEESVRGLLRDYEKVEALTTGNPSSSIVERIEKAFTYRTSKQRLQLYTRIAGIILTTLIIAIITAGFILNRQVKKAAQATELAVRQEKIAFALQNANESQLMLDNPDLIVNSVEKAVQSMETGNSIREHLLASDIALRTSMNFLPVFVHRRAYEASLKSYDLISDWDPLSVSYGGSYISFSGLVYDTILKTTKDIKLVGNSPGKSVVSPNGKYLALIDRYEDSHNSSVEVVDIAQNKTIFFDEYPMEALDISFSPNGGVLAVAGKGEDQAHPTGIAYIWDLDRLGKDSLSESHFVYPIEFESANPINAIAPGLNATYFATAQNKNVTVWNEKLPGSFKPICYIPCSSKIFRVSFDIEGKNVMLYKSINETGNDAKVMEETWNPYAYNGNEEIALPSETMLLAYDQFNKIIRLASDILYDDLIDSTAKNYYDFLGKGLVLCHSDDLKYILTKASDSLYAWNYSRLKAAIPLYSSIGQVDNAAIAPDGNYIAITDDKKKVTVWKWENNNYVEKMNIQVSERISNMKFTSNGATLIALNENNRVTMWDLKDGTNSVFILPADLKPDQPPELSPFGNYVCIIRANSRNEKYRTLEIWHTQTKGKIASLNDMNDVDPFYHDKKYAWSVDERYLIVKINNFTLGLLAVNNATAVRRLNFDNPIKSFAFSPSGKHIGVVTDAGIVRIFKTDSAKEVSKLILNVSSDGDAQIAFSAEDRFVSIASNEISMVGIKPSLSYFSLSPTDLLNEARNRLKKMNLK